MTDNKIFNGIIPGILFTVPLGILAWFLGIHFPLAGGPVLGILLGMMAAAWQRPAALNRGITFTAKQLLQYSIILLGFEMNLFHVFTVGSQSLFIMLSTIGAAFLTAWLAGHYLRLADNTSILIGVGTAICGGSAIAATAPVISATDKEVAHSISTIFLFNIVAVFLFPFFGHLLGMNDFDFGMWAGTAINDTSSVVAAGYSYSPAAGSFATIVKLTRTLMIIPVTLALAVFTARKKAMNPAFSIIKIFPWFILGFLLASIINTTGLLPAAACRFLGETGKFFIVMAMTAIGLNTQLKQLLSNGLRPIVLGLSCWLAVALVSLAVQYYFQPGLL